jgi:hypothetical protein
MRTKIITELTGYDPINDGINEEHLGKVRSARKDKGLPTQVDIHPFRKLTSQVPVFNYEFIVFGSLSLANRYEVI